MDSKKVVLILAFDNRQQSLTDLSIQMKSAMEKLGYACPGVSASNIVQATWQQPTIGQTQLIVDLLVPTGTSDVTIAGQVGLAGMDLIIPTSNQLTSVVNVNVYDTNGAPPPGTLGNVKNVVLVLSFDTTNEPEYDVTLQMKQALQVLGYDSTINTRITQPSPSRGTAGQMTLTMLVTVPASLVDATLSSQIQAAGLALYIPVSTRTAQGSAVPLPPAVPITVVSCTITDTTVTLPL
jgi:hypothetical protein